MCGRYLSTYVFMMIPYLSSARVERIDVQSIICKTQQVTIIAYRQARLG